MAGTRQRDRQRESDGDRRIHGISALAQDVEADARRRRLLRRHHAVAAVDRMEDVALGKDGLALRPGRGGPDDEESEKDGARPPRSEEHTSELQSLMRISYAVCCLKKKNIKHNTQ